MIIRDKNGYGHRGYVDSAESEKVGGGVRLRGEALLQQSLPTGDELPGSSPRDVLPARLNYFFEGIGLMSWQPELDELRRREVFAEQLGGDMRVQRQKDGGRYTIRERIDLLSDEGSFREVGKIAGMAKYDGRNDLESLTASYFVFGRATIDGRPVVIGGDDFTVRGGSADATIKEKHQMCERMANELRLPLVRLVETRPYQG